MIDSRNNVQYFKPIIFKWMLQASLYESSKSSSTPFGVRIHLLLVMSQISRAALPFPRPPRFYPVTQPPTSLCVSHPCFTQLSQPCLPSDTRPFPLSSPLNKYVLWSPSQNTLAYTHAHSQSAPSLDTDPEDSKGAVKVAGGTPI